MCRYPCLSMPFEIVGGGIIFSTPSVFLLLAPPGADHTPGFFALPPKLLLRSYKIVVSTCLSSHMLALTDLPQHHFTHFIVC